MPKYSAEAVDINESDQWLFWRGNEDSDFVILFVHGGPGTPETVFIDEFNSNLYRDFLVVSWEQRSAGKSYSPKNEDANTMTLEQFVDDGISVAQHIRQLHPNKKVVLVGHSWGTYLSLHMLNKQPELFSAYIGIGQTSNSACEELAIYEWVSATAKNAGNAKAIKDMQRIGTPTNGRHEGGIKALTTKVKWVNKFGGGLFHEPKQMRQVYKMFLSRNAYGLMDKLNYFRGESFALKFLFDTITSVDLVEEGLTKFGQPVTFCHGRQDYQVPLKCLEKYFDKLDAPSKKLVVFENSAHGTMIEEPEKFLKVVSDVCGELK